MGKDVSRNGHVHVHFSPEVRQCLRVCAENGHFCFHHPSIFGPLSPPMCPSFVWVEIRIGGSVLKERRHSRSERRHQRPLSVDMPIPDGQRTDRVRPDRQTEGGQSPSCCILFSIARIRHLQYPSAIHFSDADTLTDTLTDT